MGRRVSALVGAPIAAKTQARLSPHLPLSRGLKNKLWLWKEIYRLYKDKSAFATPPQSILQ